MQSQRKTDFRGKNKGDLNKRLKFKLRMKFEFII